MACNRDIFTFTVLFTLLLLWFYSPLLGLGYSFSFLSLYTVGLLGWGISLSQGLYLHIEYTHTIQTSMPWVGFEPTIPTFEQAKTVHALHRATTVVGRSTISTTILLFAHHLFIGGYERELISLWHYKENNKLQDLKNIFALYIPSWAPHTNDFVVLTSLTHSRKIFSLSYK
jgi:hypothetical protein